MIISKIPNLFLTICFYKALNIKYLIFMTQAVTMKTIYKELRELRNEVETVKHALIPTERVSAKELAKIKKIRREMERGKRTRLEYIDE